jgi:hypothetical protein
MQAAVLAYPSALVDAEVNNPTVAAKTMVYTARRMIVCHQVQVYNGTDQEDYSDDGAQHTDCMCYTFFGDVS